MFFKKTLSKKTPEDVLPVLLFWLQRCISVSMLLNYLDCLFSEAKGPLTHNLR